ncbi:MAG: hypothetical protein JJT96_02875 [Opitutales bacterium]|nr:hypothetical protein [Opitutales bacterium]
MRVSVPLRQADEYKYGDDDGNLVTADRKLRILAGDEHENENVQNDLGRQAVFSKTNPV